MHIRTLLAHCNSQLRHLTSRHDMPTGVSPRKTRPLLVTSSFNTRPPTTHEDVLRLLTSWIDDQASFECTNVLTNVHSKHSDRRREELRDVVRGSLGDIPLGLERLCVFESLCAFRDAVWYDSNRANLGFLLLEDCFPVLSTRERPVEEMFGRVRRYYEL